MLGSFFSILGGVGYFFGKCINDAANQQLAEAEYVKSGRKERDRLYNIWIFGRYQYEKNELKKRVGRWPEMRGPAGVYDYRDFEVAMHQIALKEGWSYKTNVKEYKYPKGIDYVKFLGPEWEEKGTCYYEDLAKAMNEETERREAWRERCPRSGEVNVYPMDCDNEDEYRKKVKRALTDRWSHKYEHKELPKGLDVYDYEDEEDFLGEKEKFDHYYGKYPLYKECPEDKKRDVSTCIYDIEKFMIRYALEELTPDTIDRIFCQLRKKYKYETQTYSRLLEEKFIMMGYGKYIAELRRNAALSKTASLEDHSYSSFSEPSLTERPPDTLFSNYAEIQMEPPLLADSEVEPETFPTQTQLIEETDAAIEAEIKNRQAGSIHPNSRPKTEFNAQVTAIGKIYTMHRENKTSKLTLVKRV